MHFTYEGIVVVDLENQIISVDQFGIVYNTHYFAGSVEWRKLVVRFHIVGRFEKEVGTVLTVYCM